MLRASPETDARRQPLHPLRRDLSGTSSKHQYQRSQFVSFVHTVGRCSRAWRPGVRAAYSLRLVGPESRAGILDPVILKAGQGFFFPTRSNPELRKYGTSHDPRWFASGDCHCARRRGAKKTVVPVERYDRDRLIFGAAARLGVVEIPISLRSVAKGWKPATAPFLSTSVPQGVPNARRLSEVR